MKITGVFFFFSLLAAVVTQAVALSARQLWMVLPGVLTGLIWALFFWRGRHGLGTLSFLVLLVMAFSGFWMGLSGLLLLASAVTALTAWDLDGFASQLQAYDPDQGTTPVVRAHLGRLVTVAAAGYLLGAIPLLVKIRMGLPAAMLLGALLVIGLSQAVHFLREL